MKRYILQGVCLTIAAFNCANLMFGQEGLRYSAAGSTTRTPQQISDKMKALGIGEGQQTSGSAPMSMTGSSFSSGTAAETATGQEFSSRSQGMGSTTRTQQQTSSKMQDLAIGEDQANGSAPMGMTPGSLFSSDAAEETAADVTNEPLFKSYGALDQSHIRPLKDETTATESDVMSPMTTPFEGSSETISDEPTFKSQNTLGDGQVRPLKGSLESESQNVMSPMTGPFTHTSEKTTEPISKSKYPLEQGQTRPLKAEAIETEPEVMSTGSRAGSPAISETADSYQLLTERPFAH